MTTIDLVPLLDAEPERDVFRLRAEILEGRAITDGLVYQELPAILLNRRVFRPIWFAVSYMWSIEPSTTKCMMLSLQTAYSLEFRPLPVRPLRLFDQARRRQVRGIDHHLIRWPGSRLPVQQRCR